MSTQRWTEDDLRRLQEKHAGTSPGSLRRPHGEGRSKYGNQKTVVDGITFDSKKEAQRYHELKCMLVAGQIFRLKTQPHYRLCVWISSGRQEAGEVAPMVGEYIADFRYCNTGGCNCAWGCTVEDVKGMKTALYRWKKQHFEAQYGIQIRET